MPKIKKIEERTLMFIREHGRLKTAGAMLTHEELAKVIGVNGKTTISEILAKRQNIQPDNWVKFKKHFKIEDEKSSDISVPRGNLSTDNSGGQVMEDSTGHDIKVKPEQRLTIDPNAYIKLLEDNDRFFKNEYHNLLVSLNQLVAQGKRAEDLIKLNLEHTGIVEALQKGVEPDVVHEQIGNQIAGLPADDEKGTSGST